MITTKNGTSARICSQAEASAVKAFILDHDEYGGRNGVEKAVR